MGTPQYMPPEQAEGRLDLLGPASDVYSLGATLYHLLTGQAPFTDREVEVVLAKVRKGEFPNPRALNPPVPPGLEAICVKAMARDAADRYRTPKALAEDVEHWLADEPVSAWPEPWKVKAMRWVGRHRTLVASVAAVLVVATAALVAGNWLLTQANAELERAGEATTAALGKATKANQETKVAYGKLEVSEREARALAAKEQKARKEADAARALAEKEKELKEKQLSFSEALLYNSTIREAAMHWRDGNFLAMRAALDECRPHRRGPEYCYLAREWDQTVRTLATHTDIVTSLGLSSDGKRLYSGSWDMTIKVWDLEAGKETMSLRGHTDGVWSLALSSDGKRLVSGSEDKTIRVWDFSHNEPAKIEAKKAE